ncbi:MAG TPA: hypothetical protein VLS48_03790 [Anaerolineales bacterium]|nr:hypothetical protein [Anaerolineales bacterium]
MSNWFRNETVAGEPIQAGQTTITPFARTMRVKLPIGNMKIGWSRPSSVLVQDATGAEQTMPVVDVTRYTIYALTGLSILTWLASWLVDRRRQANQGE